MRTNRQLFQIDDPENSKGLLLSRRMKRKYLRITETLAAARMGLLLLSPGPTCDDMSSCLMDVDIVSKWQNVWQVKRRRREWPYNLDRTIWRVHTRLLRKKACDSKNDRRQENSVVSLKCILIWLQQEAYTVILLTHVLNVYGNDMYVFKRLEIKHETHDSRKGHVKRVVWDSDDRSTKIHLVGLSFLADSSFQRECWVVDSFHDSSHRSLSFNINAWGDEGRQG